MATLSLWKGTLLHHKRVITTHDEPLLASILLRREEITWERGKRGVKEVETWVFWNIREFFTEWRFWTEAKGWN